MFAWLKKLIHIISSALFPFSCVDCKKEPRLLCFDCAKKLTPNNEIITNNIFALFYYHDPIIRKLIWYLKYKQINEVSKVFVPFFRDKILSLIEDDLNLSTYVQLNKIIIVPTPMSKIRRRKRHTNQAEILAQAIVENNNFLQYESKLISKIKHTKAQVDCQNKSERLKNIKGTFQIKDPANIKNKIYIVIDDVITTGATMKEITKLLKKSGAKQVFGIAIAHG